MPKPKIDLQESFFSMVIDRAFENAVGADPRIPHKEHTKATLLTYFRKPEILEISDTKERALEAVKLLKKHLELARSAPGVNKNKLAIERALGMLGLVELVESECKKLHQEADEADFEIKGENTTRVGKKL